MRINHLVGENRALMNSRALNLEKATESKSSEGSSFISTLKEKLDEVNEKQLAAEAATEAFIKGEDVDIHQVMLVTEEAKLSLQLAVQIRNKLVEAYQEISKMQL
jgi:flagellar hook-basal body complex protein FliE